MLTIKILLVCWVCIFLGYQLGKRTLGDLEELRECSKLAFLALTVIVVTKSLLVLYLVLVIYGINYLSKLRATVVVPVVAFGVFALPELNSPLILPGGMRLLNLSLPMMLPLVLAMSKFKEIRESNVGPSSIDKWVLTYFIVTLLLDTRGAESVTHLVKTSLNTVLLLWVPYYLISGSYREVGGVCRGVAFAALFSSLILIFEWVLVFKIFTEVSQLMSSVNISKLSRAYHFRGFGLRVGGVKINPTISAGFISALCVSFYLLARGYGKGGLFLLIAIGAVLAGILFTDVRASFLSIAAGVAVVCLYLRPSAAWRKFCYFCGLVALVSVVLNYGRIVDTMGGSWKYRADLVLYSADAFNNAPIIGAFNYFENAVLVEHMTQGQGIVDMVNVYLALTLRYGLLGLGLFVIVVCVASISVHRILIKEVDNKGDSFYVGAALLAALAGLSAFIYTSSFLGAIQYGFWYLIALCSAFVKSSQAQ